MSAEAVVPLVTIGPHDRPAPPPPRLDRRVQFVLVAGSLAVHGALLAAFWQEPKPLASIGVEVITVEIVIGATTAAGLATAPGENEAQAVASVDETKPDDPMVEQTQLRATEAPQEVPVATREAVPDEQQPERPTEQQPERQPELAMVETPRAEMPTVTPRETPPEMSAIIVPLREQPKQQKPVAEKPKPKPPVRKQERAPERQRIAAQTAERANEEAPSRPSTPSSAASGIGRGRSDNDTNYRGIVGAHLARHKQYPAAARSAGTKGSGTVSFTLDGSGRVTSSSVARGTGAAILDQELAAMVRRASPFPPPPNGRPQSFTITVGFQLN